MKILIAAVLMTLAMTQAMAAERKPIARVDTDSFTKDTQATPAGAGDNHVAVVWWIPNEFWQAILARDSGTNEQQKKAMLDALSGVSLLAIVQADLTSLGAFQFYSKEDVQKNMTISLTDANERKQGVVPMQTIGGNLEIVLGVFKPILEAAMGNLGKNMHFYVLNDRSPSATRLLDPYQKGIVGIQLAKKDKSLINAEIETPLNALYFPRKCSNGKYAHVSWNYCPWTGEKLPD